MQSFGEVLHDVAPRALVATSRRMLMNTTVLVGDGEALLVDPGWLPDELDALASALAAEGLSVIGGFATHAHHDHLLWHPGLGAVPRYASPRTAELAVSERSTLVKCLDADFPADLVELMGRVTGADEIPESSVPEGFEIEPIVHDGHAPGHTALWLPRQRLLIAGDMLSDTELPLPFSPDDLDSYVQALDRLAPYADIAEVVVPGHGHVGRDARARLDADRRYIDDMLRTGASDDPRVASPDMADEYEHMQRLVGHD
ncbi:MBL fold metallo-hydrolase [Microbacterium capsulatum]|uniref:MBL fold metallo-hydrolase n=1 Tax=Microbacterium capsulatum TaxID=3041921 RepID=A0ABU0XCI8_9MICO|nr:MBL fold metallo-hydrolase [Microbacterium sp. ASV81]MDQ4212796.1 MBL fold metallo-hydrolase [Microbacterium sp. ASV81]